MVDLSRVLTPKEPRSIEDITRDLHDAQYRGGEATIDVGLRLIEAKEVLPHGAWLDWLGEQAGYSVRQAQVLMAIAREYGSNTQAISYLGRTKAFALLSLPPGEREQFIAERHKVDGEEKSVADMTTRQLKQAIKERDAARAAAEQAEADRRSAEEARAKMEEDMRLLNALLEGSREDREQAMQDVARLEQELAELKARPVDVAVETVVDQEAVERARKEAIAEMQAKLDKARKAKDQAEARQQEADEALERLRAQMAAQSKAEKKASLGADKELAQFDFHLGDVQDRLNKMHGIQLKVQGRDADAGDRLRKVFRAISDIVGRWAE